jgi:gluconolactonase
VIGGGTAAVSPDRRLFPPVVPAVRSAEHDLRVVAAGIDHPECVAWHEGRVWCGTESGDLLAIDPATGAIETIANVGGLVLGINFDRSGRCWVCDAGNGLLLRLTADRRLETVVESIAGRRLVNPNYPTVARDGTVWVADSGRWGADDGFLFRVRPDDTAEIVATDCGRFPNGIALSADEEALYLVESRLPGIVAYPLERSGAAPRSVGPRRVVLDMPGTVPDGLAFDRAGSLFIGCWRPDRVYRLDPDGTLEVYLDDLTAEYMNSPTNVCFGGEDGRQMFLAGLCGWTVTGIDVETPGWLLPR